MSVTLISVSQDTVVSNKHKEQTRHYYVFFQQVAHQSYVPLYVIYPSRLIRQWPGPKLEVASYLAPLRYFLSDTDTSNEQGCWIVPIDVCKVALPSTSGSPNVTVNDIH